MQVFKTVFAVSGENKICLFDISSQSLIREFVLKDYIYIHSIEFCPFFDNSLQKQMLYLGIGGYLVDKGNLSGFIDLADKFSNKLSVEHHDRKSIVQSVNLYNSLIDIQKNKFENKEKIKSQIDETFIKNSNFMMNDSFDKLISRIYKENDGLNDSQLTFNESEISLSKSFENETLKSLKLFNNDDTNIFKDKSITIDEKGKIEIMKMEIKLLKDDFEIQKQFYINEIKHLNTLVDQFKRKNQEFSNENNLLKKS